MNIGEKSMSFLPILRMFLIFLLFLPLYVLTSEVAVVKSHHTISVKCSRYRDTGTTDPSLILYIHILYSAQYDTS